MAFADVKIMGILNVTPDSFYDGGRHNEYEAAVEHGLTLVSQGADIIDIGGESTRPGAAEVSVAAEIERVVPVVKALAGQSTGKLSIDTTKYEVAKAALEAGAHIINDISGLTFDPRIADIVAAHDATLVLMHTSGRPEVMQKKTAYTDIITDIIEFLKRQLDFALSKGVKKDNIILDPGIGFGKELEDNYRILSHLDEFTALELPVLIGLSRKSLIAKLDPQEEDRLSGTIALNTFAASKGASIIRVHDVREHRLALNVLSKLDYM